LLVSGKYRVSNAMKKIPTKRKTLRRKQKDISVGSQCSATKRRGAETAEVCGSGKLGNSIKLQQMVRRANALAEERGPEESQPGGSRKMQ